MHSRNGRNSIALIATYLFFFAKEPSQRWFEALLLLRGSGSSRHSPGRRNGPRAQMPMQWILTAVARRERGWWCAVVARGPANNTILLTTTTNYHRHQFAWLSSFSKTTKLRSCYRQVDSIFNLLTGLLSFNPLRRGYISTHLITHPHHISPSISIPIPIIYQPIWILIFSWFLGS